MKVKVQIFKGKRWDGHHIRQGVDTPLWVDVDSVELVGETEIEIG